MTDPAGAPETIWLWPQLQPQRLADHPARRGSATESPPMIRRFQAQAGARNGCADRSWLLALDGLARPEPGPAQAAALTLQLGQLPNCCSPLNWPPEQDLRPGDAFEALWQALPRHRDPSAALPAACWHVDLWARDALGAQGTAPPQRPGSGWDVPVAYSETLPSGETPLAGSPASGLRGACNGSRDFLWPCPGISPPMPRLVLGVQNLENAGNGG